MGGTVVRRGPDYKKIKKKQRFRENMYQSNRRDLKKKFKVCELLTIEKQY